LKPLGLNENNNRNASGSSLFKSAGRNKKVPFRAVENFTRQLSSLLKGGVPLSRALHILSREATVPAARDKWKAIHSLVIDGASLADAMAQFPETFPRVYIAMVQAGEAGGFLDVVLSQIAELQFREKELKSKAMQALIYPLMLLVLMTIVLIVLLTFFIPRFQSMFADFGAQLPILTRFVIRLSDFAIKYGWILAIAGVVGALLLRQWLHTDDGRRLWQRFVLHIPTVGSLSARFAMTRFCRMLGTLTGAGVPLIQALRVARESIGNQTLTDTVTASIERVKQGNRLAASLSDCPELFPGSILEMISVAEESGRLDEEMVRIAGVTDSELDRQLRTTVALAEPLILVLAALLIGIIITSMVLPIFTIQEYIK
ncbi:MAG: type II secretion system F family protein, partial [Candidatus Hydrogenedentes bacterium]|nr:type II secretion system F family protein [Candidatus Hydrogenedentota bacterium]